MKTEKTLPCCNRLNVKMFEERREVARQARLASKYGATPKRLAEIAAAKSRLQGAENAIANHELLAHSSQAVPA